MTKTNRIISGFLGISMFMFGVLKFVNPFKSWYSTQIMKSELPFPNLSFWSGQIGEIIVGIVLICILLSGSKLKQNILNKIFSIANVSIIMMMLVAFYVHLHPNVPSEVLPLKISPPIIPGVFMLLAIANIYLKVKNEKLGY
tara:strand:+ start:12520 stop:12945 length:426 start_codon:yes stop_codon:yes gene_type:complete